nr:phosphotransferase [Segeticoccus rhizosphaerae]
MVSTPRPVIESVVASVCGRGVERLLPLPSGGMNETYRVELSGGRAVIARIARQETPWFTDEAQLMVRARDAGIPVPEVLATVVARSPMWGALVGFVLRQDVLRHG